MTILVTRPQPDNERTGASLRARGFDVLLAPMLRFEPVPLRQQQLGEDYAAVIVTSANALRAVEAQLAGSGLLDLPLFAVGDRTAAAAREAGFGTVVSAGGDAAICATSCRRQNGSGRVRCFILPAPTCRTTWPAS